jgi:hypothetical protein
MDKSRSMTNTNPSYKKYVFDKLLNKELYDRINFDTDIFIFYNSGIVYYPVTKSEFKDTEARRRLNNENKRTTSFLDAFIRVPKESTTPLQFKNAAAFEAHFRKMNNKWDFKNFPYCYSFVSLIQPMSLAALLRDHKDLNLLDFNEIIFCSITDDADQNDQWLQDYKTVRKHLYSKQKEIDSILSKLLFSQFNAKSRGIGSFSSYFPAIEKNRMPKLFASTYQTRQGQKQTAALQNSIKVSTEQKDTLTLKIKALLSGNHLIKLDSVLVNDELIPISYPLLLQEDSIQKIPVTFNNVGSNEIALRGIGQRFYTDSLLGKRIQKVVIHENHTAIYSVNSPLHPTWLFRIGMIILAIILAWIAYYIYRLHQPKCIIIGPTGTMTIIKNGFKRAEKKKKIQYASFTKNGNTFAAVKLQNHFIENGQFPADSSTDNKQWIAIISKKKPLVYNDLDAEYFEIADSKFIQGVETSYHEAIRKKYGKKYAICFVAYPNADTDVTFTLHNDTSKNKYNVLAANSASYVENDALEYQNSNMISSVFLENTITTNTEYIMLCNKIQHEGVTILYINLIQSYSLETFSPIQVLKKYKIIIEETDDLETFIRHEKNALEKELKRLKKKGTIKIQYGKQHAFDTMLAIQHPYFPVNLSLCSDEDFSCNVQLLIFDSMTYAEDTTIEKDTFQNKIERPNDVTIEEYSIQLLMHPHGEIYEMPIADREIYALNGEDYLDIGNPDTITLKVTKNNHEYIINCQGLPLETNVLDYFYKPIIPNER